MEVVHFEDALISPTRARWIESVRSTGLWEVVVRLGSTFGCCATTSLSSRCCVSACQVLRSSQSSLSVPGEVSDLIEPNTVTRSRESQGTFGWTRDEECRESGRGASANVADQSMEPWTGGVLRSSI